MSNVSTIGIDLAKNVFQLHGSDKNGKKVFTKRLQREKLAEFMAQQPPCLVGMEACCGANYWARKFEGMGHTVKLMDPKYVKPYVKTNKNDMRDAEACAEAVTRPSMRFVTIKQTSEQDIQSLHRYRSILIDHKTALMNHTRGIAREYGIAIAKGFSALKKRLAELKSELEEDVTLTAQKILSDLYERIIALDEEEKKYKKQIEEIAKTNELC